MSEKTLRITNKLSIIFGFLVAIDYVYGMFYYKTFDSYGLSSIEISRLMSIASLSLLIFDFPSGNIADKIGRKKSSGIGGIIWGIGLLFFSLSTAYNSFMVSIIIFNFGVALNSGSLTAWLHEYLRTTNEQNYWATIISKISHFSNIVKFILNVLVLLFATVFDINILLYCGVILILFGIAVLIWSFQDDNYGDKQAKITFSIISNIKNILKIPEVRKIAIVKFLSSIFLSSFLLIYPYRFLSVYGFSNNLLPYLYFMFNFFIVSGSFLYNNFLIKQFSVKDIFKINLVVGPLSLVAIAFIDNLIVFAVGLFLFEVFYTINMISFRTIEFECYPSENKSALTSAVGSIGSLGSVFFFSLIGVFIENRYYGVWIIPLFIITVVVSILCVNKLKDK